MPWPPTAARQATHTHADVGIHKRVHKKSSAVLTSVCQAPKPAAWKSPKNVHLHAHQHWAYIYLADCVLAALAKVGRQLLLNAARISKQPAAPCSTWLKHVAPTLAAQRLISPLLQLSVFKEKSFQWSCRIELKFYTYLYNYSSLRELTTRQ